MILYSIIPADVVFQGFEGNPGGGNSGYQTVEMEYMGELVAAVPTEGNRYIIQRILSTSPSAYLNPALQPGMVISGIPGIQGQKGYGKHR